MIEISELYKRKQAIEILDIGSNKGSYDWSLFPKWNVICLDYYFDKNWVFPPNCVFIQKNFFEWNVTQKFDLIICKFVLEHQINRQVAFNMLQKITNLLNDNGYVYLVLPQGNCLSNTIYKAYYNILIQEKIPQTPKDGGHFMNYTQELLDEDIHKAGLIAIKKKIANSEFIIYPYNLFKECVEYYKTKGIDLAKNELVYLCKKRE